MLGELQRPMFLLDLRPAPQAIRAWLDRERVVSSTN
jgi:hypothetical protein